MVEMGPFGKLFAAWRRLGELLAHAVAMVLFAALYFVVFAPLALFMKLRGRRFLPHFTGKEPTYFLPKARIEPTIESMKRQW
jgi:hypothetical protein